MDSRGGYHGCYVHISEKELFTKTVMYLSTCLTLMLLVTAVSVTLTSGVLQEKAHYQIGADKEFVMSDDQNFVILLLDTVDARTFSKLLEDHPEYNKDFQDFTYLKILLELIPVQNAQFPLSYPETGMKTMSRSMITCAICMRYHRYLMLYRRRATTWNSAILSCT